MKFEVESKYEIGDRVHVQVEGKDGAIANIKFNVPVPNTYHIRYLVEFEDETRIWFMEDKLGEVHSKLIA